HLLPRPLPPADRGLLAVRERARAAPCDAHPLRALAPRRAPVDALRPAALHGRGAAPRGRGPPPVRAAGPPPRVLDRPAASDRRLLDRARPDRGAADGGGARGRG